MKYKIEVQFKSTCNFIVEAENESQARDLLINADEKLKIEYGVDIETEEFEVTFPETENFEIVNVQEWSE